MDKHDQLLVLDGHSLTPEDVRRVAINRAVTCEIDDDARAKMESSYALVCHIMASKKPTYGISTGFGEFSHVNISELQNRELQINLVRSHASATGDLLPRQVVRAMMLLRLNAFAIGYSGINPIVADLLLALLNNDIVPVVPCQGSLGASGDLANLAHMALVLVGEGEVEVDGSVVSGAEALRQYGLQPVTLSGKDGLALINGTSMMLSLGIRALLNAERCLQAANAAAALSLEALRGFRNAFDPRIHELRSQKGQILVAKTLLQWLHGSEYADTNEEDVQDAYTLRCVPQVHGATLDALCYVREILNRELNAVTDNPLVFPETGEVISGGNFHGQPLALALDLLGIAAAELANISERRTERLVNPHLSNGLPAFLVHGGGVRSGLMIPQYVAASLVSENKILAHPASVDSITSSASKEDHVSMGAIAARKALTIVDNTRRVIAIELMCAAQAIDLQERRQLGHGTEVIYQLIREHVVPLTEDRPPSPDIEELQRVIDDGLLEEVLNALS